VDPKDSFAWKDLTLEQKLAELKARNREAELRQHPDEQGVDFTNVFCALFSYERRFFYLRLGFGAKFRMKNARVNR